MSSLSPRRLWRAVSQPAEFFADLPDDTRIGSAAWPALVSTSLGGVVFALAVGGATSSDAWLPIVLLVVPGIVLYGAVLWLLGGLALSRTAALDVRGWEVAAWAWVPTGFLALALLPVVAVFPVSSLVLGTMGLPVWHLAVVHAGLREFAEERRRRALLLYALVVLAAPAVLITGILITLTAAVGAG